VSGSLRVRVTFPSSSPLEGNPSTHWAFRPVCVHPKRESSETQRTDRTRAGHHRRAFPVLRTRSPASTRCERTAAREDRSTDSKVDTSRRQEKHHRGKRPRVVISSARAARPKRTRVKNGCRARNTGPLQGSRASRAKVSSTEETPGFHETGCASRSWSVAPRVLARGVSSPRNSARAARSRRQAPEAERDAHRGEDNAPRCPDHGSTEARTAT
jgi:hypothetical protein